MTDKKLDKYDTRAGITTRFLPPTNHRGLRVVVSDHDRGDCWRLVYDWDPELDEGANHCAAAAEWINKFMPDNEIAPPGISIPKGYAFTWRSKA